MKKRNLVLIVTFALLITVIGTSYGYLKAEKGGSGYNTIEIANFGITLTDMPENVTMDNQVPVSDTDGLKNTPITFSIQNTGSIPARYELSLVDDSTTKSTMKNKDVRYRLTRTIDGNTTTLDIKNLDDTGIIDEGNIVNGKTISFELVMWIDYNSNPNGLSFKKHIMVTGMQMASLDNSGANFPELTDNMIPVYYSKTSDTEGVWKKADSTNGLDQTTLQPTTTENYQYQWFDYDSGMWANAVTVKENGTHTRDYYLNAELGTEISMDDITTMWVWIPRYKYVIFNGNNETAEEQMINIEFEHGIDTTGTVMCHDDILTDDDSDHSEICTDSTNGRIINNKSTYTHPSFCFGTKNENGTCNGEELTGFWMAKFEMSTDDETCNTTQSAENCNKTGLNILVKPDQYSLRYENISTMFANIRRMESYNNIHGFNNSENATTWLDANGNLTGAIANDDNTIDTHMIKNMEWGAVAYLSQSKYGKQGNNDYTGANKEIYINNNGSYKTGYSGGSYDSAASLTETYLYNNITNGGPGASTTGTVYGIYDMSGGSNSYVMANMYHQQGNYVVASAGSLWNSNFVLNKYSDFYSNGTKISKMKLGDNFKETLTTYALGQNSGWYSDSKYFTSLSNPWIIRGGLAGERIRGGVFSSSYYSGDSIYSDGTSYYTSHPVLTVSRDMPWLNNN